MLKTATLRHFSRVILLFLTLFPFSLLAQGSPMTGVGLNSEGTPANDLLHRGKVLSPEEALYLSREEGIDLSRLTPVDSAVWADQSRGETRNPIPDSLNVDDGQSQRLKYMDTVLSPSGLMRFNAVAEQGRGKVLTVHLSKTLHTLLLRAELLKELGYTLPDMDYRSRMWIEFQSKVQRDEFLDSKIPQQTLGAPERWVVKKEEKKVLLQDVVVSRPKPTDHYNLALGVPPESLKQRVLRASLPIYALVDLNESVNKFRWTVGRERNGEILLPHFTRADFSTTRSDAEWILRRLSTLTREDFKRVIQKAEFPRPVAKLVLEKILSRRNSLMESFSLDVEDIEVISDISEGKVLRGGRLLKKEWSGYASRFAHGLPDSPFGDWGYGLLSEVQTGMINNLVNRANDEMQAFDTAEARSLHLKEQFEAGLEDFVETGEFTEHNLGAWFAPILNGQLIVSRDLVVGPYMGTDNLVQKADTFGYGVRFGAHAGFDGLGLNYGASAEGSLHYVKTFSHLKPVRSLKESFKEPYKNIYVPYVKKKIRNALSGFDRVDDDGLSQEERENRMSSLVKVLDKHLAVGESLIVTERVTPNFSAGARYTDIGSQTQFSLSGGLRGKLIKRVHFHRKDGNTLQIYVDKGQSQSLYLSFRMRNKVPILEFSYEMTNGDYDLSAYNVDIERDLEENPRLPEKAHALSVLLQNGSTELLDNEVKPYEVRNDFFDHTSKMKIFLWRDKELRQSGKYVIRTPQEHESRYLRAFRAQQIGVNYRDFATDLVNYLIREHTDYNVSLNSQTWKNPARTLYGKSETQFARFESRFKEGERRSAREKIEGSFISLVHQYEGWGEDKKGLSRKMAEFNKRVGKTLFTRDDLRGIKNIGLYDLKLNINVYERGVKRLLDTDLEKMEKLEKEYKKENAFNPKCEKLRHRNKPECGNFRLLKEKVSECQELAEGEDARELSECLVDLVWELEKKLKFKDLQHLIGKDEMYVYGSLNGFREDSEILIEPLRSDSLGRISSRHWNGPLEGLRELIGIQSGEFFGRWMRETL